MSRKRKLVLFVVLPIVLLLIGGSVVLVIFLTGGESEPGTAGKPDKRTEEEICFDNQRSLNAAFLDFFDTTGRYPASLEELGEVEHLAGFAVTCPSGAEYEFITGSPPQVKCKKHGIYE